MNKSLLFGMIFLFSINLHAQKPAKDTTAKMINWKDVSNWKSMQPMNVKISADGKWFAYPMLTVEGDGELIVQKIKDTVVKKYSIGGTSMPSFQFSENGRWLVYKEGPKYKEMQAAMKNPMAPRGSDKLYVIDLLKDKKTEFEKVGGFKLNNKQSTYLAFTITPDRGGAAPAIAGQAGSMASRTTSFDLVVLELESGKIINIGNVGEFDFNTQGDLLAYAVDAANKIANGLYVFNLKNQQTIVLDNDKTTYKSLNWKKDKDALTALKMTKDEKFKKDKGAVIAVKNISAKPEIFSYDPVKDSAHFPAKMTISGERTPFWSEDMTRVFFGINTLEAVKKELAADTAMKKKLTAPSKDTMALTLEKIKADTSIKSIEDLKKVLARTDTSKMKMPQPTPEKKNDAAKPDMTIWHWKDKRLQSVQQVMEQQDKNFSYIAMYDIGTKNFTQLNDSTKRLLNIFPNEKFALAEDVDAYQLEQGLNGQSYSDLYIVNLKNGNSKLFKKKFYSPSFSSRPKASIDGEKFVYGEDGNYYVFDIPSQNSINLTGKLPVSFVDVEDDHNVTKPLTGFLGWSNDSRYVLISDGWDIWQIAANGKSASNLTKDGRTTKTRYQNRFTLDPEEKGYDYSKPQYFRVYGEQNKKAGIARIEPGKQGLNSGSKKLIWDDVTINSLLKSKNADVFVFSKEDNNKPTEYFAANNQLLDPVQITKNAPDYNKYLWSAGIKLVNYVTEKGDSLQGTLFLPAGYQEGKKYPTLVYYYEKLSQTAHNYSNPSFPGGGWHPTMYTGNGYAVFIPDIVYKLDDPGMSAVWAVVPAVKEAIKTGVIDADKIGITGHSWGGYQTAFLITQTNMFKAAAAGAPLTDMVSMYNLIYWNSGGGNMSIFEASQGRFRGAPWENWDSYLRNSPIYHVKNVKTPLLLLHNDKDGAVDFTQGVEYYNALRRLQKPVVMLQYKGENHGLSKLENRKDYAVRMMEFFDHYLKGKPMPEWLKNGVDKLKLADHLEERAF
ncbi:MAG TPA: prolyl oligopeptidase family serine peptidase [Niabella sp.]|jgi:dipeptidyl aminopeptidase/acylaminoacyl peptidase|nr:prolyl oligopeptidase family serine peptidase [Chitinophagaceae bacterium]HRO85121.1 prolyl oligopeptidase family serine peptidase [Niabella sp.]